MESLCRLGVLTASHEKIKLVKLEILERQNESVILSVCTQGVLLYFRSAENMSEKKSRSSSLPFHPQHIPSSFGALVLFLLQCLYQNASFLCSTVCVFLANLHRQTKQCDSGQCNTDSWFFWFWFMSASMLCGDRNPLSFPQTFSLAAVQRLRGTAGQTAGLASMNHKSFHFLKKEQCIFGWQTWRETPRGVRRCWDLWASIALWKCLLQLCQCSKYCWMKGKNKWGLIITTWHSLDHEDPNCSAWCHPPSSAALWSCLMATVISVWRFVAFLTVVILSSKCSGSPEAAQHCLPLWLLRTHWVVLLRTSRARVQRWGLALQIHQAAGVWMEWYISSWRRKRRD